MTKVDDLFAAGLSEVGKPYVYGDEGPNAFDCSGLMQFVFAKVGISLPRTADAQYRATTPVSTPLPGDLVFYVDQQTGRADHVALYLGGNRVLSAPHTGAQVHVSDLFTETGHTRTFGRVAGLGTLAGAVLSPVTGAVSTVADAGGGLLSTWLGGARQIVLESGLALAGAALIGLGIWRLAAPKIKGKLAEVEGALT